MVHVADFSVWSWGVGKCAIESSESQKVEVEGEIARIVMIMMICLVARRLKLTRLALRILEARSFRKEELCRHSAKMPVARRRRLAGHAPYASALRDSGCGRNPK